ncbi:MAG: glycosyl hydrolase 53 family protein [Prevotella sp.]|nr:glycosyl hydrolase 53 family protein [Prevotella sp.]
MRKLYTLILCFITLPLLADNKYVGGDISLLPSYESHGAKYFATDGTPITSLLPYFGEQGMNAMRVRLFVNPENAPADHQGQGVVQDLEYVKTLGKQIKDAGMALMLDFHYSDTWADPAKQWTPAAWADLSDDQLYDKIYEYTKEVLQAMKAVGATPDFIQTGNEISYGMLWGRSTDSASQLKKCYTNSDANWPRFTTLLKKAIQACREECPAAQVVIHTERVGNVSVLKAFYQKMKDYGVDYDIIGLSYYPYYHGTLSTLNSALTQMENSYADKKIMIVEVGYYHDWQPSNVAYDLSSTYPINGEGQKAFTQDLIGILNNHANVNGLFWWFMEANEYGLNWNTQRVTDDWYNAGLFDNQTGKAEPALYVLKDFNNSDMRVNELDKAKTATEAIYTIDGRLIGTSFKDLPAGIYIINGKKTMLK